MQATNHLTCNRAERVQDGFFVMMQVGIRPGSRVTINADSEVVTVIGGNHEVLVYRGADGEVGRIAWEEVGLPGFEQPANLDRPRVPIDLIDRCDHLIDAWLTAGPLEGSPAAAPSAWIEHVKRQLVEVCEQIARQQ